jgi:hypothetical protein
MRVILIGAWVWLELACAAQQRPVEGSPPDSNAVSHPSPQAPTAAASGNAAVAANAVADVPPSCASSPPDTQHTFTRISTQPVTSIAVGQANRAAVYAPGRAALFDGKTFRDLALPALPADASVRIFFGRDNQPRLMGFGKSANGGVRSVYWRYRHGRFQPEPSELGPLGSPEGALYGVLGFADPEVVCRPNVTCLVKRITGWGRAVAHTEPVPIVLSNGQVFALHADRVDQLKNDTWTPLAPARSFQNPVDAWQEPNGAVFIAEGGALVRLSAGAWRELVAPVGPLRAILGVSANDLFVAGASGAAHYDGTSFRCLRDVPGPLSTMARVGNELWIGGDTGLYRTSVGP